MHMHAVFCGAVFQAIRRHKSLFSSDLWLCMGGGALCILCRCVHKAVAPDQARRQCRTRVAPWQPLPFSDFLKGEALAVTRSQVMACERFAPSGRASRGTSLKGSWEVKEVSGRFRVCFVNQVVKERAAGADFERGWPGLRRP